MGKPRRVIRNNESSPMSPTLQERTLSVSALTRQTTLNPNISLFNDLISVSRGLSSVAELSLNAIATVTTGSAAIADSALQAYANYQFIQEAEINFEEALKKIEWVDLIEFRKQKNEEKDLADLYHACTQTELIEYCNMRLRNKITMDTIKVGSVSTTAIAAAIFSAGLLIPPAFPVTTILTIITVGAGILFTSLGAWLNRWALSKKLAETSEQDNLQQQLQQKVLALTKTLHKQDKLQHHHTIKTRKKDRHLAHASDALLGGSLVLRITVLARFALNIIGVVTGALLGVVQYFRGAVDAVVNYRNRQKQMNNLPKLIAEATLPKIDHRPFIFFGDTPLEKYIRTHKNKIFAKHQIPAEYKNLSPRELVTKLNNQTHGDLLIKLRTEATIMLIEEELKKMCKQMKMPYRPDNQEMLQLYLKNHVQSHLENDILVSGRLNSLKVSLGTLVGGSLLFPPLAPIFSAIAMGITLIGEIVSRIVCHFELKKFKKVTDPLIQQAFSTETSIDPAVIQLSTFVNTIQIELSKRHHSHKTTEKIISKIHHHTSAPKKPKVSQKFKLLQEELMHLSSTSNTSLLGEPDPIQQLAAHQSSHSKKRK